jgi:serine/threonine protein kinase
VVEVSSLEASPATVEEKAPEAGNLVGKKVSHYRVLQVLGGGGMGVVYKAEDLKLGRRVAIKFLPAELASDPNAFERLEREARAASALEHPNICPIYELGEHEGQPFIVMQLLEGQSLQERIETAGQQKKPLPTSEMLDLALQIVAGLEAAHTKGIIHRDVKPANIFITNRAEVKILDFGLAKMVEQDVAQNQTPEQAALSGTSVANAPTATFSNLRLTRTGTTVGTAYYMSPEQVRGERLDARTDVFSFGLVLYDMATGERVFPADTAGVVHDAILHREALPVRQANPQLSIELERIISKSLEKDCNLRYQHAADVRADLLRLRRDTDSAKLLLVNTRSSVRGGWREHQSAVAAGVLLVVLILAATLYIRRITQSTQIPEVRTSHRQVTFLGNAYEPAISPDGMFVAYVVRNYGEDKKLIVQAPNGSTLELAHGPWLGGPLWSPDGSDLVFIGHDGSAESTPHVFLISRLGGVARKFGVDSYACWSPDGAGIVTGRMGAKEPGLSLVDKLSGGKAHISATITG